MHNISVPAQHIKAVGFESVKQLFRKNHAGRGAGKQPDMQLGVM